MSVRLKWLSCGVAVALALWAGVASARKTGRPRSPPQLLSETGLYSDFGKHTVAARNLEYSPQYPLWSDGSIKRRWFSLPAGTAIDGSNPDSWVFPVGTKFWKEFSFHGRRIETRYLERQANGSWMYATYAWSEDGTEAVLVSDKGKPGCELDGGRWHLIPSVNDCKVCHQGQRTEVLGFGALQLSPDRDPNAVHGEPMPAPGVDLNYLVKNKLLKRFPKALLESPPRIAAASDTERAALGYLHGNCGHCHNDEGSLKMLEFALRSALGDSPSAPERGIATSMGQPIKARASGQTQDAVLRIEPGHPARSVVMQRMGSRYAALQMPPLGTVILDAEAIALVSRWIAESPTPTTAPVLSGSSSSTP
ncbi:hypothetical protein [Hyalangium rubrum]|uniref:Cytochrome c domain-containing protein n=1 Tax=Hyalangium rubrum TaxID=3103134 RepID=A0ABU5H1A4_9BACT|nr:hypothetical protein [Hyalangium sp. s54d21]MDY7226914.1 hypothetical protein [Hyalangium sp. s54d21]